MAETSKRNKASKLKIKRKLWYKIISPAFFGMKEVGESYLNSAESALGRKVSLNLRDLTGNARDQNAYIDFKITDVDGSSLRTKTIGYRLTAAFVKRLVRKNADRLDDVFVIKTKDGQKLIAKTLMITFSKTKRSIRSRIRRELFAMLKEEAGKSDLEGLVANLVGYKIQSMAKKKLSKIYPLKEVAMRLLKVQEKKDAKETLQEEILVEPKEELAEEQNDSAFEDSDDSEKDSEESSTDEDSEESEEDSEDDSDLEESEER